VQCTAGFQLVKKVSLTFLTALQPPGILKKFQNTIIQKLDKISFWSGGILECEAGLAPSRSPAALLLKA